MLDRKAEIKIYGVDQIGIDPADVGLNGSPTVVSKVKNVKSSRVLQKFDGTPEHMMKSFFQALEEMVNRKDEPA